MTKATFDPSLLSRFLNCGPTVLAVAQYKTPPNVITLSWSSPVSLEPPLLVISVSPKRYSHGLIDASGEVTINVPPWSLLEETYFCGRVSGRDVDKFSECALTPLPSRHVTPPGIEECLVTIECTVQDRVVTGDHTVFVLRTVGITADEEAVEALFGAGSGDARTIHHLGGNLFAPLGTPARRAAREDD